MSAVAITFIARALTLSFLSTLALLRRKVFNMTFKAWPRQPKENNLHHHNGNPPLSSFTCDTTSVRASETGNSGAGLSIYCAIQDVQNFDAPE